MTEVIFITTNVWKFIKILVFRKISTEYFITYVKNSLSNVFYSCYTLYRIIYLFYITGTAVDKCLQVQIGENYKAWITNDIIQLVKGTEKYKTCRYMKGKESTDNSINRYSRNVKKPKYRDI